MDGNYDGSNTETEAHNVHQSFARKVAKVKAHLNANSSPSNKLLIPNAVSTETFQQGLSLHNVLCDASRKCALLKSRENQEPSTSKIPVYRRITDDSRKVQKQTNSQQPVTQNKRPSGPIDPIFMELQFDSQMSVYEQNESPSPNELHTDLRSSDKSNSQGENGNGYISAMDDSFESEQREQKSQLLTEKLKLKFGTGMENIETTRKQYYAKIPNSYGENSGDRILFSNIRKSLDNLKDVLDESCNQVDTVVDRLDKTLNDDQKVEDECTKTDYPHTQSKQHEHQISATNNEFQSEFRAPHEKWNQRIIGIKCSDLRIDLTGLNDISDSPKNFNLHTQKKPLKHPPQIASFNKFVPSDIRSAKSHQFTSNLGLRNQARSVLQKRIQALRDYTRAQLLLLEERRLRKTSDTDSEKDLLVEYEQKLKFFQKKKRKIKLEFNKNFSQEALIRHTSETNKMQNETLLLQDKIMESIKQRKPISKPSPSPPIERIITQCNVEDSSPCSLLFSEKRDELSIGSTELVDDVQQGCSTGADVESIPEEILVSGRTLESGIEVPEVAQKTSTEISKSTDQDQISPEMDESPHSSNTKQSWQSNNDKPDEEITEEIISFKPSEESLKSILSLQSIPSSSVSGSRRSSTTRRDTANEAILKLLLDKSTDRRESLTNNKNNKSPRAPGSPVERFTTKYVKEKDISRRSSLLFDRGDLSGTGTELLDDIPNCTSFLELSHSPIPFHHKILPPRESTLLDEPLKDEVARHAKRIWSHYTETTTLPDVDDANNENINHREFVSRNFVAHWCLELSKNLVQSLPNPRASLLLKNFDAFSKHLESVIVFSSSYDGALEPHLQSVQKLARKRSHLPLDTNRILAARQLYDQHTSWLEFDVIKLDREICKFFLGSEV